MMMLKMAIKVPVTLFGTTLQVTIIYIDSLPDKPFWKLGFRPKISDNWSNLAL